MKIANNRIVYEMKEIAMIQCGIKEALQILKSIRLNEGKMKAKDVSLLESEITSIADSLGFDRKSVRPI